MVDKRIQAGAGASHPGQRIAALIACLSLWLAAVACAKGFITPAELTATAQPRQSVAGVTAAPPVSLTPPADAPTRAPTPADPTRPADPLPARPTPSPTRPADPTPAAAAPTVDLTQDPPILYYTQAGDTLKALASRFNVEPAEITSPEEIPTEGLFNPGVLLLIPQRLGEISANTHLIPDSEIVYSPSALDFDIAKFVNADNGYLTTYKEWRSDGWYDGAGVIHRVAIENSINPRLLLAILEQQSHWVSGQPDSPAKTDYPIGFINLENEKKGLYYQLSWAVQQLNIGYYGWRDGKVTELTFPDRTRLRLAPDLNAGTVSLLYLFSRLYNQPQWAEILYGADGLVAMYTQMFGNPWQRAETVEPLFPATLTQPPLELPFLPGRTWSFTGGPHPAWNSGGALAAIDFAPSATVHGCYKSEEWVTASTSGLVVRSGGGVVVIDLDGDGYEQTGWNILYLHIAADGRAPLNTWVNLNDPIGHPSCEGGVATGTHVHIARKYNGEWILADGPMPFNFSGWIVHEIPGFYTGSMTKDGQTVTSSLVGSHESLVTRPKTAP